MATIYGQEKINPDSNRVQTFYTVSATGTDTSDSIALDANQDLTFSLTTTGTTTIEVTMSSRAAIEAGTATWYDNDLTGGPTFTSATIGSLKGVSGIRVNNSVSGTTTLEVIGT